MLSNKKQKLNSSSFNSNLFNSNRGFSLAEILVTLTIVGTLALIAGSVYSRARDAPFKAMQKKEMTELNKSLQFTRAIDGGYHQKIFTMGYRPSRFLLASAGFGYREDDQSPICCTGKGFPRNTAEAQTKAVQFFTLHKDIYDASKVESSVLNHLICKKSEHCTYKVDHTRWRFSSGGVSAHNYSVNDTECAVFPRKNAHCDCNTFIISSRIPVRYKGGRNSIRAYMNEEGFFCRVDDERLGGSGGLTLY